MPQPWAIFPSGSSTAAAVCAKAWADAGWKVAVLIDADQPAVDCDLLFREPNYRGTGAAFNRMMRELDYEVVACVNDDMFPVNCPADLMSEYEDVGVIQPTGAWFDAMAWAAVSPIINRRYVNQYGSPWHEGYYHLGCDCELRDVAIFRGEYHATEFLAIDHRHKSMGFTDTLPADKRAKNNARHAADLELYKQRKAAGFP